MKKKNFFGVVLLIVVAVVWSFTSCGSGEKTTEAPKAKAEAPAVEEKAETEVKPPGETPQCASSIKIWFKAEGDPNYIKDVTDLIVGNMVDPVTGDFWYQPPPENPWTWVNDGSNCRAFGLMGNYKYKGNESTALSKVVIDPTKMTPGAHEVVAYLCTCERGPGNILLRFKSATLDGQDAPGIVYVNEWGTSKPQPACPFYDCPETQNPQK